MLFSQRAGWSLVVYCSLAAALLGAERGRETSAWPTWRGPNRDAKSNETELLQRWRKKGPPLKWQIGGLGKGFSSVAISDGRIFTMGKCTEGTFLIALDLQDGRQLWSTPITGGDPNCTPTIDGNRVYALGREGELLCADVETGEEIWRKHFRDDFGGKMMSHWGYSESPLVDGDRLLCTPGAGDAMIVALEKQTGDLLWKSKVPGGIASSGAGYASIVISEACGIRQYVQLVGSGLISVAAQDGRFLWSYERIANRTANVPTPLVSEDYVFCSTGYGTGAALLHLVPDGAGVKAEEVYFLKPRTMQNHHGGMVLLGGHVYCGHGHNKGFPLCIELKTGKVAWSAGRGPGQRSAAVLYADSHLYFRYEDGTMALIEANPNKYVLKGRFKIAAKNGPSWPHPVIVGKRLYLRDGPELLCYDIAAK